jgi:hypothetical protein
MATLGEEYPKQQARVRTILGHYKEIGPVGSFGAAWIENLLQRADKAAIEQDLPAMIACFKEMQEVKS